MAQIAHGEHDLRRVLDEDREVDGLGEQELLEMYRSMVLLRTYDERSVVYHRQGRIGTYAIFWNHEAMQAGSVHALAEEDWIFPSYRESAIGLLRGMPPSTVLHWWRGHPAGWWNPAEYRVASICVPIATHVPHAAGLAWGEKLKGNSTVATADDPRAYIDLDRVEEEKRNECVGRYDAYLRRLGVLDDATAEEIKNEALEAMRQGITKAEAEPEPDPELVFDNAYVLPPPNLREGWDG